MSNIDSQNYNIYPTFAKIQVMTIITKLRRLILIFNRLEYTYGTVIDVSMGTVDKKSYHTFITMF